MKENVNKCYADRSAGGMAEEININKVATEATDVKGAASIYYTLAVEKVKDVSVSSVRYLPSVSSVSLKYNSHLSVLALKCLICLNSSSHLCKNYFYVIASTFSNESNQNNSIMLAGWANQQPVTTEFSVPMKRSN